MRAGVVTLRGGTDWCHSAHGTSCRLGHWLHVSDTGFMRLCFCLSFFPKPDPSSFSDPMTASNLRRYPALPACSLGHLS